MKICGTCCQHLRKFPEISETEQNTSIHHSINPKSSEVIPNAKFTLLALKADLGDAELRAQIARGDFGTLREWLRRKVHSVGSVHASPDELLTSICGEPVSPRPFLDYLRAKYSELYEL